MATSMLMRNPGQRLGRKSLCCFFGALLLTGTFASPSLATLPYTPAGGPFPLIGPGVASPTTIGGKEIFP